MIGRILKILGIYKKYNSQENDFVLKHYRYPSMGCYKGDYLKVIGVLGTIACQIRLIQCYERYEILWTNFIDAICITSQEDFDRGTRKQPFYGNFWLLRNFLHEDILGKVPIGCCNGSFARYFVKGIFSTFYQLKCRNLKCRTFNFSRKKRFLSPLHFQRSNQKKFFYMKGDKSR